MNYNAVPKRLHCESLKLIDALPHTPAGRAISAQLVRSAMSVGANYEPHAVRDRVWNSLLNLAPCLRKRTRACIGWK